VGKSATRPNHNHFICPDCDKLVEFDSDKIARLEAEISHELGFALPTQRLQITASCEEFKKLGACKKMSAGSARGESEMSLHMAQKGS
jgi:Fur family ferric uptake transcriptional regulator